MNIQDHFSESLETVFELKILKLFDVDLDLVSGMENSDPGIRHNHPRSATLDVRKKSVCQIFDEGREFPATFKATNFQIVSLWFPLIYH